MAHEQYENMTGGWWLWTAPEYFITSCIAQTLNALEGPGFITLEHGASHALESAGGKGRGRLPRDFRENGKVDILLWWGRDEPRAVIEVKNQVSTQNAYEADINRIKAFLNRNTGNSSLQFGILSFYQSASDGARKSADEKIKDRITSIRHHCLNLLGEAFSLEIFKTEVMNDLEKDAWQAVCFLIRKKNNNTQQEL